MRYLIKAAASIHIGLAGKISFGTSWMTHRLRAISRQESVMFSWPRPATGAPTRESGFLSNLGPTEGPTRPPASHRHRTAETIHAWLAESTSVGQLVA